MNRLVDLKVSGKEALVNRLVDLKVSGKEALS